MIRILAFIGALTVGAIAGLALAWATSLIPGAIAADHQPHPYGRTQADHGRPA